MLYPYRHSHAGGNLKAWANLATKMLSQTEYDDRS
jgi:hypothetical protein